MMIKNDLLDLSLTKNLRQYEFDYAHYDFVESFGAKSSDQQIMESVVELGQLSSYANVYGHDRLNDHAQAKKFFSKIIKIDPDVEPGRELAKVASPKIKHPRQIEIPCNLKRFTLMNVINYLDSIFSLSTTRISKEKAREVLTQEQSSCLEKFELELRRLMDFSLTRIKELSVVAKDFNLRFSTELNKIVNRWDALVHKG